MAKWSKSELLCNARGLDDGYLYMYHKHPFGKKLAKLALEGNKTAASSKERLTDSAAYGFAGFTGSVRPPLSNEIHPLDPEGKDCVRIPLPSSASKIDRVSHDNLFSEPIEANEAVCVAFTEPLKYSHKSILLAGANPLPCRLTAEDLRIRRPKLNRFGGTIANLGMSRSGGGQSFQAGYGSMNISSYERDLAQRTGRGHELYQPGTRAWGAMEPTPKRQRPGNYQHNQHIQPQHHQRSEYPGHNPFSSQSRGAPQSHQQAHRPPWQNQQQGHHHQQQRPGWQQPPPPPPPPPPRTQQRFGHQQHIHQGNHHQQRSHTNNSAQPHPHQQRPNGNQQPPRQQGYNFQALAQQQHSRPPQASARPPQQQGRADGNVMNNLRAQLVSTLKKNHRPGQGQNDGRR